MLSILARHLLEDGPEHQALEALKLLHAVAGDTLTRLAGFEGQQLTQEKAQAVKDVIMTADALHEGTRIYRARFGIAH